MPRVDTTPVRRAKREAQQRLSRGGRSASSVSSVSGAVKVELLPSPKATLTASPRSWRHPDELPYIRGGPDWTDAAIVRFIVERAVGIPARSTLKMAAEPWVHVQCAVAASVVLLPREYRLPLLWVLKFQRTSLELVLSADATIRAREWDAAKFEILHIARLCSTLIDGARVAGSVGKMTREWRCGVFDRALLRYWNDWLIMRDEFVRDFWREFGEEDYAEDVLKLGWAQWVLKGHKGFTLTKQEVTTGISAAEFMQGFVVNEATDMFKWIEDSSESSHTVDPELPIPEQNIPQPLNAIPAPNELPVPASSVMPPTTPQSPHVPEQPAAIDDLMSVDPTSAPLSDVRAPSFPPPISSPVEPPTILPAEDQPAPGEVDHELSALPPPSPALFPDMRAHSSPLPVNQDGLVENAGSPPEMCEASKPPDAATTNRENRTSGYVLFRGHPTDIFKALLAQRKGSWEVDKLPKREEESRQEQVQENQSGAETDKIEQGQDAGEEEEEEEEEEEDKMVSGEVPTNVEADELDDDLELDDDEGLQLMYPSSPVYVRPPGSHTEAIPPRSPNIAPVEPARSLSLDDIPSRSASPVQPLSATRFPHAPSPPPPPPFATEQTSYEMTRSPRRALLSVADIDPGMFARATHAWTDELRALRTEMGLLRAALPAVQRLSQRVKALEEATPRASSSTLTLQTNAAWAHPLQHLIVPMDVDVSPSALVQGLKYAGQGEPLPPRSRKFSMAGRFSVV
ncbi:hypothetical protein FB451DRAFT_1478036 [Mycena latifolia]|nr:hypothetical protein FB451DRAFT_1478036 [Mycena latifolia]